MDKNYKQQIIEKFKAGIHKIDIAMRKLTACDEEIFLKSKKDVKLFCIAEKENIGANLEQEVCEEIQSRVQSAITHGYSELSMFITADKSYLKKDLNNAYKYTVSSLLQVPDDVDIAYKDKDLNYKTIQTYTGLEIMQQNEENAQACSQLLKQMQENTNTTQLNDSQKVKMSA